MEQFVLIPYSVYQSQSTILMKKIGKNQQKEDIVPKDLFKFTVL